MIKFEKLPYFIRSIIVASMGYKLSAGRYGKEFSRFSSFLENSSDYSPFEKAMWQKGELVRLALSAKSGTLHYRDLKILQDASLETILKEIPLLQKSALRSEPDRFFNTNVEKWLTTSTSGTSGSPMTVEHCKFSMQRRFAILKQHLALLGIEKNAPSVRLSGRIIADPGKRVFRPWLFVPSENQLLLSSYHLNAAHEVSICRKLKSFAPQVIDGYSSAVLETLRLLARKGFKPNFLKAIVTTAETLSPLVRDELERLSGAKVLDYYAASEGVPIIQQCPYGVYHVRWESGIFEVLKDDKVSFEGDGELVVTSFIQERTPLIRYRTGDHVIGLKTEIQKTCQCGLKTPTIERIDGRIEDLVFVRGGKRMGMFTYRTLKDVQGLAEAQVFQKDYDKFRIELVLRANTSSEFIREEIKERFERVLGYAISLELREVESISRGPNGKVRLVVNEMDRPKL